MKSILDPTFRYTNSDATDIRKTFARVRREQQLPPPATTAQRNASLAKLLPHLFSVKK